MSWLSKALGMDARREAKERDKWAPYGGAPDVQYREAIHDYRDPTQGMSQLGDLIKSQVSRAMPQFQGALQGVRENAIQRGMSTGDLGTSYEGDLASAFQQNLADSISAQTYDLYSNNRNTYLDLISGQMDRDDSNKNAKRNRDAALTGGIINGVSNIFSFGKKAG